MDIATTTTTMLAKKSFYGRTFSGLLVITVKGVPAIGGLGFHEDSVRPVNPLVLRIYLVLVASVVKIFVLVNTLLLRHLMHCKDI